MCTVCREWCQPSRLLTQKSIHFPQRNLCRNHLVFLLFSSVITSMHGFLKKLIHLVCFISNVYKQRFFQPVRIFENISNTTGWTSKYQATLKNSLATFKDFDSYKTSIFNIEWCMLSNLQKCNKKVPFRIKI